MSCQWNVFGCRTGVVKIQIYGLQDCHWLSIRITGGYIKMEQSETQTLEKQGEELKSWISLLQQLNWSPTKPSSSRRNSCWSSSKVHHWYWRRTKRLHTKTPSACFQFLCTITLQSAIEDWTKRHNYPCSAIEETKRRNKSVNWMIHEMWKGNDRNMIYRIIKEATKILSLCTRMVNEN